VSNTETNQSRPYGGVSDVEYERHTKHKHAICVKNAEVLCLKKIVITVPKGLRCQ
jgi:hypothetical protein